MALEKHLRRRISYLSIGMGAFLFFISAPIATTLAAACGATFAFFWKNLDLKYQKKIRNSLNLEKNLEDAKVYLIACFTGLVAAFFITQTIGLLLVGLLLAGAAYLAMNQESSGSSSFMASFMSGILERLGKLVSPIGEKASKYPLSSIAFLAGFIGYFYMIPILAALLNVPMVLGIALICFGIYARKLDFRRAYSGSESSQNLNEKAETFSHTTSDENTIVPKIIVARITKAAGNFVKLFKNNTENREPDSDESQKETNNH